MKIKISENEKKYLRSANICTRAAAMDGKVINEEQRTARTVLATETPAVVIDWERWDYVREILLITEKSVMLPETKQLPLLDSHERSEVAKIKGSLRDLQVVGNELVGYSHFAKNADNEFELVRDGHLTDVSVGYKTFSEQTLALPKGERAIIDGREFVNDYEDGMLMLIRTQWQPKEGSLVAIGADENAKFRTEPEPDAAELLGKIEKKINEKFEGMKSEIENKIKFINTKGEPEMEETKFNKEEILKAERERISAIESFAERFSGKVTGLKEKAAEAVREGKTVEEFRGYILDNLNADEPVETPASQIGMSGKDMSDFSISRAILAAGKRSWADARHEREIIEAVAEATGKTFNGGNIILPREMQLLAARTLTAGTGSGSNVVGTDLRGDEYIEFLRNRVVLAQAGMRTITGLKADIALPKQTAGATVAAIAEGSAATPSDPTITQVTGAPNTITGATKFSRKLLIQSNPSIDAIVYDDLYQQLATKIDYYGLHGTGTAPQPEGIANVTGIGSVSLSSVTWAGIVEFESDVETANANVATMNFVTNAAVKGKMKTTLKASSVQGYLMEINGEMNGYPSLISENVASGYLFFGDWAQLIFAEWGSVELIVDPYTEATSALITTTITDEIDFLCRQPGAFSVSSDVAV